MRRQDDVVETDEVRMNLGLMLIDIKRRTGNEALVECPHQGGFVNENFAAFTLMHCGETDDEAMREGGGGADWYVRASNLLYSMWAQSSAKPRLEKRLREASRMSRRV